MTWSKSFPLVPWCFSHVDVLSLVFFSLISDWIKFRTRWLRLAFCSQYCLLSLAFIQFHFQSTFTFCSSFMIMITQHLSNRQCFLLLLFQGKMHWTTVHWTDIIRFEIKVKILARIFFWRCFFNMIFTFPSFLPFCSDVSQSQSVSSVFPVEHFLCSASGLCNVGNRNLMKSLILMQHVLNVEITWPIGQHGFQNLYRGDFKTHGIGMHANWGKNRWSKQTRS